MSTFAERLRESTPSSATAIAKQVNEIKSACELANSKDLTAIQIPLDTSAAVRAALANPENGLKVTESMGCDYQDRRPYQTGWYVSWKT
jgi:hypothetical protein